MPTSVLVIDDSEMVRDQIIQTLRKCTLFDQYREAGDGIEGFKALITEPADLVLCDLEMPRMDGFKFLALMQSQKGLKDIPVIMLTGREDTELKIRGLEQGACDYVTKPFDAGELVARVKVQLKIKALQDALKRSNELLTELSNTDPLTGLSNRRYFAETLEREFPRSVRKNESFSLAMGDIDYFKKINDTYGHQEGDMVLTTVATFIRNLIRRYDVAARYGGEEFAVILPDTDAAQAIQFAERLRKGVEALTFSGRLQPLTVTISIGVATFPSPQIDSIDKLVRSADEALYRAKKNGRNRVESREHC
ncbi:diguanylate cyclase [Geomobilimonas luticola]|uniref:diguanylate cyclase n=1 Tax=Geomobilimonas luticola TaxID=1114878 RepID=A0ABS5S9S8_9BACT|nr:diguanylate cyclase [Geomobilimonas luticola]MBT0652129.1 diguanylate cyclase [Geomobilimonas luticola]